MPPRLGALLAVLFWGVSFVATKAVVREISPVTLIFTRAGLGTALLAGILALRRQNALPPRDALLPLAAMGFVGVAFHQLLQAHALTLTSAVNTGWLIGLTPLWSAILSAFLLRERFGPGKIAGLLVGFAGAVLVVTRGELGAGLLALPATRGDLLVLASTLNWALYTVLGHPTIRRLGPTRATAGAMLLGWLMLAPPFAAGAGWNDYGRLSPAGWLAVLFLGVACSGLGYLFWYGALERVEASRVAALLYLEPLVTLAAAVVLLGEPVRPTTVLGGLMVVGGVVLVQAARGEGRPGGAADRARRA
ncbi:MAG TPA: DMT family transporter [Anaeromyxobacteraceae bacterium]|nr:DMT family transporter [Anaeromyxobacteraceae bacterium]